MPLVAAPAVPCAGPLVARLCRAALACFPAGAAGAAGAPAPHPGPPVWAELRVEDAALTFVLHGEPKAFASCLGLALDLVGPFAPERARTLEQAVEDALRGEPRLAVGGRPLTPSFVAARFPEDTPEGDGWLVVDAELRVPLDEPAREVALTWERYDGCEWNGERFLPVTVLHGRSTELFSVWPAEPELVWHAPLASLADAPPALVPASSLADPPKARLPLAALVALGAGGLCVLLLGRRGAPWRWGAVALACGVAWLARGVWVVPLGGGLRPPGEAEAERIFERLHAGLYAAFDAESEDAIYERLAACVAPELVDPLYGEVWESLVMREQGGAVCSITSVDVREATVLLPPPGSRRLGFDVEAAWDVEGVVSHWGHLHRRRNTYRARYAVERFEDVSAGATWKIAGVEVRDWERVDE